ncbi:MAG: IS3 family transposase [Leptospirales bacterium]
MLAKIDIIFKEYRQTYGYRRVKEELSDRGFKAGKNRSL